MAKRSNKAVEEDGDVAVVSGEVSASQVHCFEVGEPSKDEILEQLRKPGTYGKTEKKRELVKNFVDKRELKHAGDADLVTTFTNLLPTASDWKNAHVISLLKLCEIMYNLKDIFKSFRSKAALPSKTCSKCLPISWHKNLARETVGKRSYADVVRGMKTQNPMNESLVVLSPERQRKNAALPLTGLTK